MARAKLYCKGINKDGGRCTNWAVHGSYYCQQHQYQHTQNDSDQMENTNMIGCMIVIGILVIAFLISLAAGCEDKFLKYLSK